MNKKDRDKILKIIKDTAFMKEVFDWTATKINEDKLSSTMMTAEILENSFLSGNEDIVSFIGEVLKDIYEVEFTDISFNIAHGTYEIKNDRRKRKPDVNCELVRKKKKQ